jgi:hypothetical protein
MRGADMSGLPCCIGEAAVEPDCVDPHPAATIVATSVQRAAYWVLRTATIGKVR